MKVLDSVTGFTIVETLLFLAITGLLVLIVSVGQGEQTRQTQFSDSMESIHSKLTRLQAERNATTTKRDPSTVNHQPERVDLITEVIFNGSDYTVRHCHGARDSSRSGYASTLTCEERETGRLKWDARHDNIICTTDSIPSGITSARGLAFVRDHETGSLRTFGIAAPAGTVQDAINNEYARVDNTANKFALWIRRADGDQCGAVYINANDRLNQMQSSIHRAVLPEFVK